MCARYPLSSDPATIAKHFGLDTAPEFMPLNPLVPNNDAPVVIEKKDYERTARLMRWGLIPWWAKDVSVGEKMINAPTNKIFEEDAFKKNIFRHRCLIPAEGFFEIKHKDPKKRQFLFHLKNNGLIAFAGIWARWHYPDDEDHIVDSFTVITTDASALTGDKHDSMPVIICPEDYNAWLDPETEEVGELIMMMEAFPVEELMLMPT